MPKYLKVLATIAMLMLLLVMGAIFSGIVYFGIKITTGHFLAATFEFGWGFELIAILAAWLVCFISFQAVMYEIINRIRAIWKTQKQEHNQR